MSHLHRFYHHQVGTRDAGEEISLPEDEAHHALSVVRLREGERVAMFDGRGNEVTGPLLRRGRRQAAIVVETARYEPVPAGEVLLAPALLQRDKPMEEIIRRGTELGVTGFVFWRGMRSQRAFPPRDKWQRLAVESCKQSGRLHLPSLEFFDGLRDARAALGNCILFAELGTSRFALALPEAALDACAAVIGPEGDFAEEERDFLRNAGAWAISLGANVLRTEAAATVMATMLLISLGRLGTRLDPPLRTQVERSSGPC